MKKLFYKAQTRYLFHSNIKIKIPIIYEDIIFEELFGIMEEIDKNYNSYSENSYFDQINKNTGNYVTVDKTTLDLLLIIKEYSDILNGSYDITIMPLIKLWGFYKKNIFEVPIKEEIDKILEKVNYKSIKLDIENQKVCLDKRQEIITGSFIKSFAVDQVIKKLEEKKIEAAIINAGGSSIRGINSINQKQWIISVTNPDKIEEDIFDIGIKDMAYSTSAIGENDIKINNKRYSHIINPKTGYPSENKQVGIITKECLIGDILSTGLYNCNPEEFLKIMKELQQKMYVEGFLLDKNNNIYYSDNFLKHIKS